MRFLIKRTSHSGKPCSEAFYGTYTIVGKAKVDDPVIPRTEADDPAGIPACWYEDGKNHRIENGCLMRDFDEPGWFIEINNLEELLAFAGKYGDLIISCPDWRHPVHFKIEIYDGWRE